MNKITEKVSKYENTFIIEATLRILRIHCLYPFLLPQTNGAQGSGDGASTPTFVDGDEQHSAEGFLCPFCMTAFSSPEVLAEHYQKEHERVVVEDDTSSLDPSMHSVSGSDADRDVAQLQTALDVRSYKMNWRSLI